MRKQRENSKKYNKQLQEEAKQAKTKGKDDAKRRRDEDEDVCSC